jgi:hypothetical protein
MGSRLRRMRGRFYQWIQIKTGPQQCASLQYKSANFSIQSFLESPKRRHMRSRGPPDLRPIPEDVCEPISTHKKYLNGPDGAPYRTPSERGPSAPVPSIVDEN